MTLTTKLLTKYTLASIWTRLFIFLLFYFIILKMHYFDLTSEVYCMTTDIECDNPECKNKINKLLSQIDNTKAEAKNKVDAYKLLADQAEAKQEKLSRQVEAAHADIRELQEQKKVIEESVQVLGKFNPYVKEFRREMELCQRIANHQEQLIPDPHTRQEINQQLAQRASNIMDAVISNALEPIDILQKHNAILEDRVAQLEMQLSEQETRNAMLQAEVQRVQAEAQPKK